MSIQKRVVRHLHYTIAPISRVAGWSLHVELTEHSTPNGVWFKFATWGMETKKEIQFPLEHINSLITALQDFKKAVEEECNGC